MNKKTKNLKIKFELNIVVAFYTRKKNLHLHLF